MIDAQRLARGIDQLVVLHEDLEVRAVPRTRAGSVGIAPHLGFAHVAVVGGQAARREVAGVRRVGLADDAAALVGRAVARRTGRHQEVALACLLGQLAGDPASGNAGVEAKRAGDDGRQDDVGRHLAGQGRVQTVDQCPLGDHGGGIDRGKAQAVGDIAVDCLAAVEQRQLRSGERTLGAAHRETQALDAERPGNEVGRIADQAGRQRASPAGPADDARGAVEPLCFLLALLVVADHQAGLLGRPRGREHVHLVVEAGVPDLRVVEGVVVGIAGDLGGLVERAVAHQPVGHCAKERLIPGAEEAALGLAQRIGHADHVGLELAGLTAEGCVEALAAEALGDRRHRRALAVLLEQGCHRVVPGGRHEVLLPHEVLHHLVGDRRAGHRGGDLPAEVHRLPGPSAAGHEAGDLAGWHGCGLQRVGDRRRWDDQRPDRGIGISHQRSGSCPWKLSGLPSGHGSTRIS